MKVYQTIVQQATALPQDLRPPGIATLQIPIHLPFYVPQWVLAPWVLVWGTLWPALSPCISSTVMSWSTCSLLPSPSWLKEVETQLHLHTLRHSPVNTLLLSTYTNIYPPVLFHGVLAQTFSKSFIIYLPPTSSHSANLPPSKQY